MDRAMKVLKKPKPKHVPRVKSSGTRKCRKQNGPYTPQCMCHLLKDGDTNFPRVWSELRNNMQLCDGVVVCEDDHSFKIHRAILSAVSPFFKALFLNTINRGQPEVTEVSVQVPSEIFSMILDYAYSGHCDITNENVKALLIYGDQLDVLGIVTLCCQYIIEHLYPSNCLEVLQLARKYFCRDLEERGQRFVKHHFKEVMQNNPDFYKLSENELYDILADDELNCKSEELVFEAVKHWVEHEPEVRRLSLPRLLKCVRIGLLSCSYFAGTVLTWSAVMEDDECQNVLRTATSYLSMRPTEEDSLKYAMTIRTPRVPYEVLFTIGGWSAGSPTNFVETYDARANRWMLCVNTDVTPRAYHAVCTFNDHIYMIGGFDGNEHFNTMRSFNPVTRLWRDHACMYYPRCYISIAVQDGKIYALGGYNGRNRMNSAERYDPNTNQWELIAPMHKQRSDASAAELREKIYIVGGFNGTEVLRSAEMYDPSVNQWSFIPTMIEARSGVSLISHKDALYAIGGFNGYTRLQTVEKLCSHYNKWCEIAPMLSPRSNFASVILDKIIYVIGGFNGSTTIANTEYYNEERNEWIEVAAMNLNRSALAACVIRGLPNAVDYSYRQQPWQPLNVTTVPPETSKA